MIFGGVESERIQLNEDTIWAGEKRDRNNPDGARAIREVRRLLAEGKPGPAEALADKSILSIPRRLPPYQTLGDLRLTFPGHDSPSDYTRSLDIDTGIARIEYEVGGARFTRDIFSSAIDQVLVIRLECDRPKSISFSATLTREADAETNTTVARDGSIRVTLDGEAIARGERHQYERKVGVRFRGILEARIEGGSAQRDGKELVVTGANAVTLVFAAATGFRHKDWDGKCTAYLDSSRKSYSAMRAAHIADHQRLFRRVDFTPLVGCFTEPSPDRRALASRPARRERFRARSSLFSVWALPVDGMQPSRHYGGNAAGHLERAAGTLVGKQVHDKHQHANELLARGGVQPVGAARRHSSI